MSRAWVGLFHVKLVSIRVYVPAHRALTPATSDGTRYEMKVGASAPFPTGTRGLRLAGASGPGRCATSVLKGKLEKGVTMIRPAPPEPPASVVPVESAPPPPPPGADPAEPAELAEGPPLPPAPPPVTAGAPVLVGAPSPAG